MKIWRKYSLAVLSVLFAVVFYSCRETTVPKPAGYFRIDMPSRNYVTFDQSEFKTLNLPLSFEYPSYGKISTQESPNSGPGWFNIEIPSYHAKIYLTYISIKNDLDSLLEQNYNINIKSHITKADAINEQIISYRQNRVYGILYDLKGNTATAVQFFITDSLKNFLRGSLYFSAEPNPDSLAPVIQFFRQDIVHLIESLKWTNR